MPKDRRRQQLDSTIQRSLQEILRRRLSDPRIRGMISITEIDITSDLREARVRVSIFPEQFESVTLHGLKAATLRIQRLLNRELTMRRPPHISFELDRTLKKQASVLAAINEALESDAERAGEHDTEHDTEYADEARAEETAPDADADADADPHPGAAARREANGPNAYEAPSRSASTSTSASASANESTRAPRP